MFGELITLPSGASIDPYGVTAIAPLRDSPDADVPDDSDAGAYRDGFRTIVCLRYHSLRLRDEIELVTEAVNSVRRPKQNAGA